MRGCWSINPSGTKPCYLFYSRQQGGEKLIKTLFVGIDVSKKSLVAYALDDNGEDVFGPLNVTNNRPGAVKIADTIIEHTASLKFNCVKIGMEATNVYWENCYRFMQQYDKLSSADFTLEIITINPKVVKNFKDVYNDLNKSDSVDAWVIADRLRFGRIKKSSSPQVLYKPLRQLTRFRFKSAENLKREKSRALNLIFIKFSDYDKTPIGNLADSSMALLEHFSLEEIITKDLNELASFLIENSNNSLGDQLAVEKISQAVKKAATDSYRLKPKMNQAISQTLSMTFDNIRFLNKQIKKANKVIARELKAIPQTLTTIPGIGPVFSSGILAEIVDVNRFQNQANLASYAGLTWHQKQSGSFKAEETPLSKKGNKYLRYYLVGAANSLRVHNDEYRRYYLKKHRESNSHHHKRALVLTARKFVRLVFALLSKGEIYQPRG